MKAKEQKSAVNYSRGMGTSRCKNCVHYHSGICDKVVGSIDPEYWCIRFDRR